MTDSERKVFALAADLLDLAEQEFSNHGSNDYPLDDMELIAKVAAFEEGSPSDYVVHEGKVYLRDYVLMQYCAAYLRGMVIQTTNHTSPTP